MAETRLRGLIRDLCASTDLTDPRDLAASAVRRLADDELRAELDAAAVSTAREVLSVLRASSIATDDPAGRSTSDTQSGSAGRVPSQHGRTALIRNWVAEQMRARLHVEGQWKLLRDCTLADLAFAAQERRQIAAATAAEAERYDRLAKAVADSGADSVGDLDEATFAEAWGRL